MRTPKCSLRTHSPSLVLPLALLLLVASGCASRVPLADPYPIATSTTPAQTRIAIVRALVQSNWTVQSEQPGRIIAHFGSSAWSMTVAIDYADEIAVRYQSSENLDYDASDGVPTIHAGYNKRVQRLGKRIANEIVIASDPYALPPIAAPPRSPTPAPATGAPAPR